MQTENPFLKLMQSRKAIVVVVVVAAATVALLSGKLTQDQWTDLVKWVTVAWLGAQAAEDAVVKSAALKLPSSDSITSPDRGDSA